MTNEQKQFIKEVVIPTLIELATKDNVAVTDFNLLNVSHFKKATTRYNKKHKTDKEREERIIKLGCFIADDDVNDA